MITFDPIGIDAAKTHAIACYPREACGVISGGGAYIALENIAENPHDEFQMPARAWLDYGPVQAVLHSHIVGKHPHEPSAADVNRQQESGVPWGVIHCGPDSASDPLWFGDHLLDAPLIGRQFVFNVTDCWQLIRAWYWQNRRVRLANPGADPRWFERGENQLVENARAVGWWPIPEHTAMIGDMCFMRIRSQHPNHCAVMHEHGILMHHLQNRLSCRESAHRWQGFITGWYRWQK